MGLDAAAFSPKEFGLAIQAEATIGTQVTTGMTRVNVDSVEMPGFNLTQVMEARSGSSGRLSDADDVFVSDKGTVKEISFSGICDTVVLPLLIQNSLATAISDNITTISSSYTPAELENGEASGIQKTFTLAILAPTTTSDASPAVATNRNMCFPGCTITSLSITGSMDDESGRLKFSATAQTGYQATYNQGSVTVSTAYGSTFYSLATLSGAKTIAGATDSVVQSFSLNIENPSFYSGQSDNNGNPDAIARAIPELNIGMDATVKYDDNTAGYMNSYKSGSNAATLLCNDSDLSQNGTTFGFQAANGRITSVGFNEANAMMLDVSTKFVVSGSTDFFAIHT